MKRSMSSDVFVYNKRLMPADIKTLVYKEDAEAGD